MLCINTTKPEVTIWLEINGVVVNWQHIFLLNCDAYKEVVKEEDINLSIIPISIRQIMKSMDNIPFPPSKNKGKLYVAGYRRASLYKVPVPKVPPYP